MDTLFARVARTQELNEDQRSLVIGSLLGDAYLVRTTRGHAFRVNHGPKQKDYVDWKFGMLNAFTNSPPRYSKNCYYFRTVSHQTFDQLHTLFYKESRKIIPEELIEAVMNPLILAVWIMDDGTREGNQLRINSQSFDYGEQQILRRILRAKLGLETSTNRDKNKFRLRFRQESMAKLIELVRPHFVPSMLYKLPL